MRTVFPSAGALLLAVVLAPRTNAQPPQAPPQTGVVSAGSGNPYARAAQLPARILRFDADNVSLKPGQSATLTWATENPSNTTIEPELGVVRARGSKQVTPAATTTYTLTVRGPNNQVITKELKISVAGTTEVSPTAAAGQREVPRMPDGKPNLSGVYNSIFPGSFFPGGAAMNIAGRPGEAETKPVLKAGAEKFKVVRGPEDSGLSSDCMPLGVPQELYVPYQWQIVQGLDRVVILYEYPHVFRVIPTKGGPHQADLDPTWMGDAIGHWEGDTLVVDTIGFNDRTEVPGGYKHTEALHVVERFRRTKFDNLEYLATIEDPNVFEKPWVVSRTFPLRQDLEKVDEFVCENNRDYRPFFKK
jgi:hypothetical protein